MICGTFAFLALAIAAAVAQPCGDLISNGSCGENSVLNEGVSGSGLYGSGLVGGVSGVVGGVSGVLGGVSGLVGGVSGVVGEVSGVSNCEESVLAPAVSSFKSFLGGREVISTLNYITGSGSGVSGSVGSGVNTGFGYNGAYGNGVEGVGINGGCGNGVEGLGFNGAYGNGFGYNGAYGNGFGYNGAYGNGFGSSLALTPAVATNGFYGSGANGCGSC